MVNTEFLSINYFSFNYVFFLFFVPVFPLGYLCHRCFHSFTIRAWFERNLFNIDGKFILRDSSDTRNGAKSQDELEFNGTNWHWCNNPLNIKYNIILSFFIYPISFFILFIFFLFLISYSILDEAWNIAEWLKFEFLLILLLLCLK